MCVSLFSAASRALYRGSLLLRIFAQLVICLCWAHWHTTFHVDNGSWNLPLTPLDSLWKLVYLATEVLSDSFEFIGTIEISLSIYLSTGEPCKSGWNDWDAISRQTWVNGRNHILDRGTQLHIVTTWWVCLNVPCVWRCSLVSNYCDHLQGWFGFSCQCIDKDMETV